MAAYVATKTQDELTHLIDSKFISIFDSLNTTPQNILHKIIRLFKRGYMNEIEPLKDLLKTNTHNMTFKEAYDKTGIVLNIAITE